MINIGDFIIDNDPRIIGERKLEIVSIFEGFDKYAIEWNEEKTKHVHPKVEYVLAKNKKGARFKIRMNRIFTDGKKRRSGFSLIPKLYYDEGKDD